MCGRMADLLSDGIVDQCVRMRAKADKHASQIRVKSLSEGEDEAQSLHRQDSVLVVKQDPNLPIF